MWNKEITIKATMACAYRYYANEIITECKLNEHPTTNLVITARAEGYRHKVEETSKETEQSAQAQKLPDLSNAVEKRIEGKTAEAIKILRKFNSEFPDSHAILIQLARALLEADQFSMSAFRFDQAIAAGASEKALKEAAQAYTLAGDLNSAAERFGDYLLVNDKDFESWAKYGRVLANLNQPTKAINALTKGSDHLT